MDVSVIVPAFNEKENIRPLFEKICRALAGHSWEVIFIDDGSTDGTSGEIKNLNDERIVLYSFPENRGQSAALFKGFQNARGQIIITIDADLQNDPEDIPKFIRHINQGYDAVLGVRMGRRESLPRRIQTRVANRAANILLKERFRDRGCGMKCLSRTALKQIKYFKDFHMFLPSQIRSLKVREVAIEHHSRLYGRSKFGGPAILVKGIPAFFRTIRFICGK